MAIERIYLNKSNNEMTHNCTTEIANKHRNVLNRVQAYFGKAINIDYQNSNCVNTRLDDSIIVNMWSALEGSDMILPENNKAFGFEYCADGVYVPNKDFITYGDDVPLIQFKDNNFYFLYDVCEYNTQAELDLMAKLLEGILVQLAGSPEAVEAKIAEVIRIEEEKKLKVFIDGIMRKEKEQQKVRKDKHENNIKTVESYRKEIRKLIIEMQMYEETSRSNVTAIERIEENLRKELEVMKSNKKISNVYIDDYGCVVIETKMIYANVLGKDNVTRRYRFGEYKVVIDMSDGDVKFYNQNDDDKRNSCWGDECNHPHVDEGGYGCLGSASSLIMDCVDRYQWGILADVLVNYLESVNIADTAGKNYWKWDEVDKDNNLLPNQYKPN